MSDIQEFEKKVREIFHLITEYGSVSIREEYDLENLGQINDPEVKEKFIIKCHDGWKLGQDRIVEELILITQNKKELEESLKKIKDKTEKSQIIQRLKILNFQELVLRKLADSIAWTIFGTYEYIARRFAIKEEYPLIQPENLLREKKWVDEYNEANPTSFALLADITSFIQIGDMITIDIHESKRTIKIFEIKDGQLNQIMRCMLDQNPAACEDKEFLERVNEKFGEKAVSQIMRMKKQDVRMDRVIDVINTGRGIDPIGDPIRVSDDTHVLESFDEMIECMLNEVETKRSSIGNIENCLFIGVYSGKFAAPDDVFKCWMDGVGIHYPITDFRSTIWHPVATPPFLLPIGKENIFDLIFGRKKILMCLDFDRWFELCQKDGVTFRWSSTKKADQVKKEFKKIHTPYIHNNRMIQINFKGLEFLIGGGFLTRIFFNFYTPKSVLETVLTSNFDKAHGDIDPSGAEEGVCGEVVKREFR